MEQPSLPAKYAVYPEKRQTSRCSAWLKKPPAYQFTNGDRGMLPKSNGRKPSVSMPSNSFCFQWIHIKSCLITEFTKILWQTFSVPAVHLEQLTLSKCLSFFTFIFSLLRLLDALTRNPSFPLWWGVLIMRLCIGGMCHLWHGTFRRMSQEFPRFWKMMFP